MKKSISTIVFAGMLTLALSAGEGCCQSECKDKKDAACCATEKKAEPKHHHMKKHHTKTPDKSGGDDGVVVTEQEIVVVGELVPSHPIPYFFLFFLDQSPYFSLDFSKSRVKLT